jgi:hypothetical protein
VSQLRQGPDLGSTWLLSALGERDGASRPFSTDPGTAFFCRQCERTVSLLPSFALSYRLLNSALVERFLTGQALRAAEQRWEALLQHYRAKIEGFSTRLVALIGLGFGLAPPATQPVGELVDWLTRLCGGLGPATEQLVNRWAVTLFGIYRCHQRMVDD